jgi:hypothetical protein
VSKLLLLVSLFVTSACLLFSNAYAIDFSVCEANPSHHCYSFSPKLNEKGGLNTHVTMFLPNNGAATIDGIYSPDNYTHLQNNIAVISVQNIYSTTSTPTLNYCPTSEYILENQGTPTYLNKFYDGTPNDASDLTSLIYLPYCYAETGPNPINGDSIIPVPEFGSILVVTLAIAVLSMVVFTAHREIRK